MTRPKVYVLKEQVSSAPGGIVPFDYTPAYKYGDIEFVTQFDIPTHPRSTAYSLWYEQVRKFLDVYRPGVDYIIPTGSPSSILAFGQMLGKYTSEAHRTLVWNRKQSCYHEGEI